MSRLSRTEKLLGAEKLARLSGAHVLIVGLGGVGGFAFEMLLRAGIGRFTLVDGDKFDETNLNRQILATTETIGTPKTDAAVRRAQTIAPETEIKPLFMRYNADSREEIFWTDFDYCCDCIDSVKDKADLLVTAAEKKIPTISAMGAGNRIDPEFCVTQLYQTKYDGLARAVRRKLKDSGLKSIKVVCDEKEPLSIDGTPGSISYAPAMMGAVLASEIIKDLLCRT